MRSGKSVRSVQSASYFILALTAALLLFSPLIADPDLWGHVRFGQDTLLTGQVVRADPYSYLTAGQPWINHEWLTEVVDALVYNSAGTRGLIALNSVVSLLIAGLIYWRLQRAGMNATGALLLTLGASFVLRPAVLNVRPQVFTYLLFLVLLLLIDGYTTMPAALPLPRGGGRKLWFPIATSLLLALWANLHGGFLAGLGILTLWGLLYLGGALLRTRSVAPLGRSPQREVVVALACAPLAVLLNPYGRQLLAFLLRTATVARPEVVEWHSARLADPWSQCWLIAVGLTLATVGLSRRPRRLCLLVPLAVIALLPLSAIRHIPLFAVAAPVLAADHFADLWDRISGSVRIPWRLSQIVDRAAMLVLPAAALGCLLLALPRLQAIVVEPRSAGFPVDAVAALKAAGARGNMATEFNWGEYVIWQLGPAVQVSVDGRRETVYLEAVYRENLDFMRGQGQWDRLVDRPETELALVDVERPVYELMRQKPGWTLAYADRAAAVFVRDGSPLAAVLKSVSPSVGPADGAGLAFPVE